MLLKRVIVCLDVRDGKTTKGVRFKENKDLGDPVEMARRYYRDGADELVFYDITASSENRGIMLETVEAVARKVFIPFSVGGGLRNVRDMKAVILAGAEKVSLNTAAVENPDILSEGAKLYGRQCIVLGLDAGRDESMPSGYRVFTRGGRVPTEKDALRWALEARQKGAGEIVLNVIDTDGTREGYALGITRAMAATADIPVVASGGAGTPGHLVEVFRETEAEAALVAGMVHYNVYGIGAIKEELSREGIPVRGTE